MDTEAELETRRAELRRKIDVGIQQLDRGDGIIVPLERLDDFFEEIKRECEEEFARRRRLDQSTNDRLG